MRAMADITWPGGRAAAGETINPLVLPEMIRARWVVAGILIAETKSERERWGIAEYPGQVRTVGLVPFTKAQMAIFALVAERVELKTTDLPAIAQTLGLLTENLSEVITAMVANGLLVVSAKNRWRVATANSPMLTMMRTATGIR